MILLIISLVTSPLGIIGFFADIPLLIIIGAAVYIIETVYGLASGELKSISTTVLSSIISIPVSLACNYNVFFGWCLGLCVECLLLSLISLIMMLSSYFSLNSHKKTFTVADIYNTYENDEVIAHAIYSGKSYKQITIKRTATNAKLIKKWLDKSTKCLYMFVRYVNKKPKITFVTRKEFNKALVLLSGVEL